MGEATVGDQMLWETMEQASREAVLRLIFSGVIESPQVIDLLMEIEDLKMDLEDARAVKLS